MNLQQPHTLGNDSEELERYLVMMWTEQDVRLWRERIIKEMRKESPSVEPDIPKIPANPMSWLLILDFSKNGELIDFSLTYDSTTAIEMRARKRGKE